jgi:glucan phosphoethanolaminetransferase (alkaline phosphatase superfamily)
MQTLEVINTGDLADGSYSAAPTSFWTIRYLDLGISIPVGFIALFMLLSKPERAYSLVLLFFGFFVTTATAVNAMAVMQLLNNDPAAQSLGPGIAIFAVLGVLSYSLLYYLVRDKVAAWRIGVRGTPLAE